MLEIPGSICSHTCALSSLARGPGQRFDREIEAFVNSAKFEWIRHQEPDGDISCTPLTGILTTAKKRADYRKLSLTSEETEIVRSSIVASNSTRFNRNLDAWNDVNLFRGSMNPEALLLSYRDLSRTGYDRLKVPNEALDEGSCPRLPDLSIIEKFNSPLQMLPVSERGFPSCHAYIMYMQDKCWTKILYPGHHPHWSATTLPPWMLKGAAEYIIAVAEEELTERINEILRLEAAKRDKSRESTSSDPDEREYINASWYNRCRYGPFPKPTCETKSATAEPRRNLFDPDIAFKGFELYPEDEEPDTSQT